jgi:hypothetical protein
MHDIGMIFKYYICIETRSYCHRAYVEADIMFVGVQEIEYTIISIISR